MKKILIPIADGFEEIETMTLVDILRRAGMEVVLAGIKGGTIIGSRKVKVLPDRDLNEVLHEDFDAVVLPGGQPGVDHLRKDSRVIKLLQKYQKDQKWIGAICAAPMVLGDAGLIAGKMITSYPGVESELTGALYRNDRVVCDGRLITSRGPGSALEFSLKLVELIAGKSKADEIAEATLAIR